MKTTKEAQAAAWVNRQVADAWRARYLLARREGFSEADAQLHADQAAQLRREELA